MDNEKRKQTIKFCIAISILVIIVLVVISLIVKYQVEGEKNLPFNLSKIIMISTAEGVEKNEKSDKKWNLSIYQNNDIYLYIDKNEKKDSNEILKSVKIENIQITKQPKKGIVRPYMPNSSEGRLYDYAESYLVNTKLEYIGAAKSNPKNLEVGNQGGTVYIRFSNTKIGDYLSNDDKEIVHDGKLLKKINVNIDEIKFNVKFDFTIETDKTKYKTTIDLDMPSGNIIEQGTTNLEETDMSDLIFKRIN